MYKVERILCPTDFSEGSLQGLFGSKRHRCQTGGRTVCYLRLARPVRFTDGSERRFRSAPSAAASGFAP
jgi:hypothetical protein